jgi:type I restriction enzyme R subunit
MRKSTSDESEQKTRKRLIHPKLRTVGWRIVRFDPRHPFGRTGALAIEEFPTDNGPADYALCVDGQLLGVVEAKKVTLGPQNVLTQAERYSRGATQSPLNFHGFRVPFLYSTNGEVLWHHDVRHPQSRSRRIARFHTPDALQELLTRDAEAACEALLQTPNDHPRLRPYQADANAAVERALAERKRHMLVAMATGTGKTFTMVNQVYRLMKAGVARRVLFPVDRRALAAQAAREFASFEADPGRNTGRCWRPFTRTRRA